jgi:CBS domain-containing protein
MALPGVRIGTTKRVGVTVAIQASLSNIQSSHPWRYQMQTIQEVMSTDVQCVAPTDSIRRAAQLMEEFDVGALPVLDGDALVGMITDRDIVMRSSAKGKDPESDRVGNAMSPEVATCHAAQTVDEVLDAMGDLQIRRVPVVEQDTHKLVGMVALGDLSRTGSNQVDDALRDISSENQDASRDIH